MPWFYLDMNSFRFRVIGFILKISYNLKKLTDELHNFETLKNLGMYIT